MNGELNILMIVLACLAGAALLALLVFAVMVVFGLTWKILRNIVRFIGAEVSDALRLLGAGLSALLFAPLVVLNIVIGRWSASRHFAGAFWDECRSAGACAYRLAVGNPARMFGAGQALEGVERRVPKALADAPGRDRPARRVGQFEGYTILGSLQGGGSGGKLYIAEPDAIKRAGFARQGLRGVDRVVVKVFSLKDGSSLPQIVRESRALDAAKKLGLVLEHELTPDRFFYVMRYVPGDALSAVTQRLHAESPAQGLDNRRLAVAVGYAADLLASLDAYHHAGLWHKDVKPDNIIIDASDGKAHLVDFGLVTPLRSAMTLTTHGTEYFRDPELVRQALRGVKVHEIDGTRFDIYGAGAVLFSVIENSFPAHGGLSQLTRRCPEALRWIVRRAMTDYDRRYPSAAEMLADLRVVQNAPDPFALKPIDLPSVAGQGSMHLPEPAPAEAAFAGEARRSPQPPPHFRPVPPTPPMPPAPRGPGERPKLSVSDWWTGRYSVVGATHAGVGPTPTGFFRPHAPAPARPMVPPGARKPAREQVQDARTRARQRRRAAQERIASRRSARPAQPNYSNTPTVGVVFAGLLGIAVFLGMAVIVGGLIADARNGAPSPIALSPVAPPAPAMPPPMPPLTPGLSDADLPRIAARVLVVSDLGLPLSPRVEAEVHAGLGLLRERGAVLSGDLLGDNDDATITRVASLRRDRGRVPFDSDDLPERVRVWLGSHDADAVLLLAPAPLPGGEGGVQSLLVGEDFHTRLPWDAAPAAFVRVLANNRFTPTD